MNVILAFPGQGSQYVGMGKNQKDVENIYLKANQVLGFDLHQMILEGPSQELKKTAHTQPAIVAYSLALFYRLKKILDTKKHSISMVLGHSVGEYSALAAAEVLSFEDVIKSVHLRGKFMQEAAQGGTMFAILKEPQELIEWACNQASQGQEIVSIANYNEPMQTVISGHLPACLKAIEILTAHNKKRVKALELQVSAPFHCSLMKPAEEKLKPELDQISFQKLKYPYVANVDAEIYGLQTSPTFIKDQLVKQVCSSVLWTQSLQKLAKTYPDSTIIECGPGKVLTNLIRKTIPQINLITLDQENGWQEVENL